MTNAKGLGPTEAPIGSFQPSDYSESYHERLSLSRREVFATLMRHTGNVGEWTMDWQGARISHVIPTEGFGPEPEKYPVRLHVYFDPLFGRLHIDTSECPIRPGLRALLGVPVRQYVEGRRYVQVCHVAYLEAGPTGRAFQVSRRINDPCDFGLEQLVLKVIRTFNDVGTEAIFLRECLG